VPNIFNEGPLAPLFNSGEGGCRAENEDDTEEVANVCVPVELPPDVPCGIFSDALENRRKRSKSDASGTNQTKRERKKERNEKHLELFIKIMLFF
jgi:hypothetical protein